MMMMMDDGGDGGDGGWAGYRGRGPFMLVMPPYDTIPIATSSLGITSPDYYCW